MNHRKTSLTKYTGRWEVATFNNVTGQKTTKLLQHMLGSVWTRFELKDENRAIWKAEGFKSFSVTFNLNENVSK